MRLAQLAMAMIMLGVAACASVRPALVPNIYVMRHLHTPAGAKDPDLTEEGRRHALLLAERLAGDPPAVIYVSSTKRAAQTAAPLAQRVGVTPKVYDPANTPSLVASVLQESGTVLIVGHSNTVPEIVAQLGGDRPGPLVHEDFGDLWHIAGPERRTVRSKL